MDVIVDTDILSTLGKIREYELLLKLFPQSKIFVSPRVYQDLIAAKELGYDFVEFVLNYKPQICSLSQDENPTFNHEVQQKEKRLRLVF